jgi:hypothetical protein
MSSQTGDVGRYRNGVMSDLRDVCRDCFCIYLHYLQPACLSFPFLASIQDYFSLICLLILHGPFYTSVCLCLPLSFLFLPLFLCLLCLFRSLRLYCTSKVKFYPNRERERERWLNRAVLSEVLRIRERQRWPKRAAGLRINECFCRVSGVCSRFFEKFGPQKMP